MPHDTKAFHGVRGHLPCQVHHALHAILSARHETWEAWLLRKAQEELEIERRAQPEESTYARVSQ